MGSKVSSKMAAPTARVIQAVRPHAPLIKFPNRQGFPRPNVQEVLKVLAVNFPQHTAPSASSAAAPPPLSRPRVPLTSVPGTPDTLASVQLLPARYRRRPLTLDEMDYIQVISSNWGKGELENQLDSGPRGPGLPTPAVDCKAKPQRGGPE